MNPSDYAKYNSQTAHDAVAPSPQPFTDVLGSQLSTLLEVLQDAGGSLAEVGDRVLGAIPRGVTGSAGAEKPHSASAAILTRLETAIAAAREVRDEARRLQSGI
jgi:hypothetical protein